MSHKLLENLKYSEDHEWALAEGEIITIGLTDFAQSSLGDIVFVELPEVGREISKGDAFGVVESIKSVNDLYSPVSGEITEINQDLEEKPDLCNSDPYGSWIIKVKASAISELDALMDSAKYNDHCQNS